MSMLMPLYALGLLAVSLPIVNRNVCSLRKRSIGVARSSPAVFSPTVSVGCCTSAKNPTLVGSSVSDAELAANWDEKRKR